MTPVIGIGICKTKELLKDKLELPGQLIKLELPAQLQLEI